MKKTHFECNQCIGSRLLLLTGICLAIMAFVLICLAQPLIRPRVYLYDNGKLLIADNSQTPETILANAGIPLGKLDSVSELKEIGTSTDRFYQVRRSKTITVADHGRTWTTSTLASTVRDLMKEEKAKFALKELDRVEPSPDTLLKDKMEVKVTRVSFKDETREEKIQPDFKLIVDPNLPRGRMVTEKPGKPGLKETTYRNYYKNGKLSQSQKLSERVIKSSESGVKKVGSKVLTMSRSGYHGKRMLEMEATAYDAGPLSTGKSADGITATGAKARYGIVAVDPKVIPLGTKLFVEGYGYAVAADTGGAIKGLRIDLFFESRKEALKFGRRKVKVYILE